MHHEQVSPSFVEKVRQYPRFSIYLGFIFLITLSDALLSYWTPIYIQDIVGSATVMGIILAVSSIVGLIADTYLPQLIKKINITKLMLFTAIFSVLFVLTILSSQYIFTILLLLIAVGFWGIYYELLAFTNAIFLTKVSNSENRSSFWAILYS
ncbi:hypothetical protein KC571_03495, partial [candidate division WWE3 bacterium]|nr:hypothetical protein [candidate division WWE3 bacterium]